MDKETFEAIEVIFGDNKIWWPANSPDLSPIETVWAILKRELSKKKKHTSLDELREHTLDIWCKFPVELCKKIVGEFNNKIRICMNVEGKILNKHFLKNIIRSKNRMMIKIMIVRRKNRMMIKIMIGPQLKGKNASELYTTIK